MSPKINTEWDTQKENLALDSDQIHVWSVHLDIDTQTQIKYWRILSEEERKRADAFKFVQDKIKYIACRGVLRQLLGFYLKMKASEVEIGYIKNGKPYHDSNLEFNVSHSHDWAVIGFTLDTILGIDIEYIERKIEYREIAHRFFSAPEVQKVSFAPDDRIANFFFNCWTRKEAFIKALGDGLSFPLDCFEVSCAPEEEPELLKTTWDEREVENWSLWGFEKDVEYIGALTIRGPRKNVFFFTWDQNDFNL
ncbi:MAG: 4'-phosphopantetheinyl transferase superfamily protein [Bacteroidota bacterium]